MKILELKKFVFGYFMVYEYRKSLVIRISDIKPLAAGEL